MTDTQLDLFLASYATGCGIVKSCEDAGVSVSEFRADLCVNREFRRKVKDTALRLREDAEAVIYEATKEGRSVPAAVAYLKLKEEREARRKARGSPITVQESEPNYSLLDRDQWTRYAALHERLMAGEMLNEGDAMVYIQLHAVAMSDHARENIVPFSLNGKSHA